MSIGVFPGVTPVGGASPLGGTGPSLGAAAQPTAADKAKSKAEASAAANRAVLAAVRDKGVYAWAQEQKLEKLKEKIRQQVMAEHKMDDAALSRLDPAQRASAEKSIEDEIAERIQEAMKSALEGEAKSAARQGKSPSPMIIDISV